MMSGVVEASVLTSASGNSESARKKLKVAPNMATPRAICVRFRDDSNRRRGLPRPASRTTARR